MLGSPQHYHDIADKYHDNFFYEHGGEMENWKFRLVLDRFQPELDPKSCKIADIGAGTGRFMGLLHEALELKNPVVCVDNSAEMLADAEKNRNLEAICLDGVQFGHTLQALSFDCFLLMEVTHHFPPECLPTFYAQLHAALKPGGTFLTITHPHSGDRYPFFADAKRVWAENQPEWTDYGDLMKAAGFEDVQMELEEFTVTLPKAAWLRMIKNRFWSTFSHFNDEQLAAGIEEIRRDYPADENGFISFREGLVLITARKS